MQADPIIQDPTSVASLNRYSYCWNNPLNATDPSGFVSTFNKIRHGWWIHEYWSKHAPIMHVVSQIGLAFIPGGGPYYAMAYGANQAYYESGGKESAGIKSFGISLAAMGAYNYIGHSMQWTEASKGAGVLGTKYTAGAFAGKVFAHAMVGGVTSVLQGGKFGHGFAAAGVTQLASGAIDGIGGEVGSKEWGTVGNRASRIAAAATVGGTISAATGGKFVNGAFTGAFSRAFNDEKVNERLKEQARQRLLEKMECRAIVQDDDVLGVKQKKEYEGIDDDRDIFLRKNVKITGLYKCTDGNRSDIILGSRHVSYWFESDSDLKHFGVEYGYRTGTSEKGGVIQLDVDKTKANGFHPYDSDVQEVKDWANARLKEL